MVQNQAKLVLKTSIIYPKFKVKSLKTSNLRQIHYPPFDGKSSSKKACISLPYIQSNDKINIPSAFSKVCFWFPYLGEEGVMVMWGILRLWGREALLPFCWNESEETNWWRSAWTSLGWTGILWNTKKRFYHWTLICDNVCLTCEPSSCFFERISSSFWPLICHLHRLSRMSRNQTGCYWTLSSFEWLHWCLCLGLFNKGMANTYFGYIFSSFPWCNSQLVLSGFI